MFERKPQRSRRDEISHHADVHQRLAPLKHGAFVAVVHIEHDVGPAVRRVVANIDHGKRQRAGHQQRQAGQAVTPVDEKVRGVGQPQHHRKILGQKRATDEHARQRIQPIRWAISSILLLSPHQGSRRQHRPENQRRVGGDQRVEPIEGCQPKENHRPGRAYFVNTRQSPPQRRANANRQQHRRQADGPKTVAQGRPHGSDQPAHHGRVVVVAPVGVHAPPVEKGFVPGDGKGIGDVQAQDQRAQAYRQQPTGGQRGICRVLSGH